MMVRAGWTTRFGERKFDVELDEDDIRRILRENGIPLSEAEGLTVAEAFGLLHHEAEAHARLTLLQTAPLLLEGRLTDKQVADLKNEIRAHRAARDKVLQAVRSRDGTGG